MSASEEIYGKVVGVLVDSLSVDEDEITPTSSLQGDLGLLASSDTGASMPVK